MKIYWKISDVPGMAELSTEEQKVVWRRCVQRSWKKGRVLLFSFAIMLASILLLRMALPGMLGAAIGGGIGGLFIGILSNASAAEFVDEEKKALAEARSARP
ncbi:MAG: hypothetical protein U0R49_01145 [Fimbriimonadales bacterium]